MKQLFNHICLDESWPPVYEEKNLDKPLPVPYLKKKPETIGIDIGRQLFVDDFLIAGTNMERITEQPEICEQPVFEPVTETEMNGGYCTCACPFNDGIFYDDEAGKFKMWYHAGWFDGVGYAESEDGIHWKRLSELIPDCTDDRVVAGGPGKLRDGSAMWLDYTAASPDERYKMLVFFREYKEPIRYYPEKPKHSHDVPGSVPPAETVILYKSADGIHWQEAGTTGPCGDNTTFFFNPFTEKWVFSTRTFSSLDSRVRVRGYYETDDFFQGSNWKEHDIRFWARTDIYDAPDWMLGYYTQLYNLDAVAYESVMLGVYSVFMGPSNNVCEITKMPKINDLKLAFSRDGFHWDRGQYENFIASSRIPGSWNYGYMHVPNGICTVVGDEIYFYFSCFSGKSPKFGTHKYSGGSLGLAKLRRDGFACMADREGDGWLTTERLESSGSFLFINADAEGGRVSAELLDRDGQVVAGYSRKECRPMSENSTCHRITWNGASELKPELRKDFRIKFYVEHAKLYSFWIADNKDGLSHGYMAAGGPGFKHGIDR